MAVWVRRNARGEGEREETKELIQRRRQMSIWNGNGRRGAGERAERAEKKRR